MHQGLSFAGLAAIALLAAAPLSFAQQAAAPPAVAATPAMPAMPATPGATTTTTTSTTVTTTTPPAVTGACHTRKSVGRPCSCRSAPTTMGTSTAPTDGGHRNMCVIG